MEPYNDQLNGEIERYLGIYKRELLGAALVDRLHIPVSLLGSFFVFLYFGILLILHTIAGNRLPANLGEVLSHPSASFYYPNLIGITYDLIANPFLLSLLMVFRHYIPQQFRQLDQDGLIQVKPSFSRWNRFAKFVASDPRAQFFAAVLFPLVLSLLLAIVDIRVSQPADTPAKYAIFLTLLGRYANLAITIYLAYIFIILSICVINVRLNLAHPDRCSGLAPFGNLAIATYTVLFVWAMILAIGAGGSAWQLAVKGITGLAPLIYLWILFPLAILFIFEQLLYRPHHALLDLQRRYLKKSGQAWTNYHQNIQSSLMSAIKTSQVSLADKSQNSYSDDMELLEIWSKLDRYVADTHIWPISSSTLRLLAIFVNPFLPIIIPGIVEFLVSRLP